MIDTLAKACEHVGFFYAIGPFARMGSFAGEFRTHLLLGHGIPNELLLRTLSVTRQLFDLDATIKNQYAARLFTNATDTAKQVGGLGRGYQSVGENVTNTKRDRHEGFDLYRELDEHHPLRSQFNSQGLPSAEKLPDYRDMALGRNPWPREIPQFRETITEYTSAMLRAGERVMRAIALSLNLPVDYFHATFNDSFWVIVHPIVLLAQHHVSLSLVCLGHSLHSLSSGTRTRESVQRVRSRVRRAFRLRLVDIRQSGSRLAQLSSRSFGRYDEGDVHLR